MGKQQSYLEYDSRDQLAVRLDRYGRYWRKRSASRAKGRTRAPSFSRTAQPRSSILVPSRARLTPKEVLRDLPNPSGTSLLDWRPNTSPVHEPALQALIRPDSSRAVAPEAYAGRR